METAEKRPTSTIENIVIISAVTEKRKIEKRYTYMLFADAVKCLDNLRLQDCIIVLAKLGYSKIDLETLYNFESSQVKINTPYGNTKNRKIRKRVKQDNTWTRSVLSINSNSK